MSEPTKDELAEAAAEMAERLPDETEQTILRLVGAKRTKRPTLFDSNDLPGNAMEDPLVAAKFISRVAEVSQLSDVRQEFKDLAAIAEVVEEERCLVADAVFATDEYDDWVPLLNVAVLRGHAESVLEHLSVVFQKTAGDMETQNAFAQIADRINKEQEISDEEAEVFESIYNEVVEAAAETEKMFSDLVDVGREALEEIGNLPSSPSQQSEALPTRVVFASPFGGESKVIEVPKD